MGDGLGSTCASAMLAPAQGVVVGAQVALRATKDPPPPIASLCEIVDAAGARLADLAGLELLSGTAADVPAAMLLAWRDHLSSHALAARAVADIGVDLDVGRHILERGLADVAAEIVRRLTTRPASAWATPERLSQI